MKLKNVLPKLILLSIFAIFVTACSSDDDYGSNEPINDDGSSGDGYGDGDDGGSTDTPTTFEVISESESHTTLEQALIDTDLVDAINEADYTIFAPTDAAFEEVDLDALTSDEITNVLLNHVVAGTTASADLSTTYLKSLAKESLSGDDNALSLYVNVGEDVILNGTSKVTTPDIEASNGVVHVVDEVISIPDVTTFATADPTFATLVEALTRDDQPDFVTTLSSFDTSAPFTVFAPTNNAFTTLLSELEVVGVETLADIDGETLTTTLNTHVVSESNITSSNLPTGTVQTLGEPFDLDETTITDQNGRSIEIVVTDVQAGNGIVHVVDAVILPDLDLPTGNSKTYDLGSVGGSSVSGTATFIEMNDNSITVELDLVGTPDDGEHPAHIHVNSVVETGDIARSLTPVDGSTGKSSTNFTSLDDGSSISYDDLLDYDGHINVHLSSNDLTVVAQGDIGQNELTGESKSYDLNEKAENGISGSVLFEERVSGDALATISLNNTPAGGSHPAHIHENSAVEGGGILFSFAPVDGDTGMSQSNVAALDDNTAFGYADVLEVDGYVNVHLSSNDLTVVAQGDIGQNELTGESKSYDLNEKAVDGISGSVLFEERVSGEALATLSLENTPAGGSHPAHIHENSAVEGGGILYSFAPVDGDTGMSQSNVAALDDDTAFGYADVLEVDGYVNVHLSSDDLGTIVAQGDIGQNELTGNSVTYDLNEKAVDGISGSVLFEERVSGDALATISLVNTPAGGSHPAHIHENSVAEGGGILFSFTPVDGDTGMSHSHVEKLDDDTAFGYADVLEVDGYINVHLSSDDLETIVAQGNIGANEGQTQTVNYDVTNSGSSAYIFNGGSFTNESNPDLTLERGKTYTFTVDATGHPFYINTENTTGSDKAYNSGVTNNGASDGTITFTVPDDAPDTLYYNCSIHSMMNGTITITD